MKECKPILRLGAQHECFIILINFLFHLESHGCHRNQHSFPSIEPYFHQEDVCNLFTEVQWVFCPQSFLNLALNTELTFLTASVFDSPVICCFPPSRQSWKKKERQMIQILNISQERENKVKPLLLSEKIMEIFFGPSM